jgi:hypothetical protein
MKSILLSLTLLTLAVCTPADTIQHMQGTLTGIPTETITYDLTISTEVQPQLFGGQVEDVVSGTILIRDAAGALFNTWNITDDMYIFPLTGSMILFEFGTYANVSSDPYVWTTPVLVTGYDWIGTRDGVTLVFTDNSVAADEPSTVMLILVGAASLWRRRVKA